MEIYFKPKGKDIIKGLQILKEYIAKIYIERPKIEWDVADSGKN